MTEVSFVRISGIRASYSASVYDEWLNDSYYHYYYLFLDLIRIADHLEKRCWDKATQ